MTKEQKTNQQIRFTSSPMDCIRSRGNVYLSAKDLRLWLYEIVLADDATPKSIIDFIRNQVTACEKRSLQKAGG